MGKKGIQPGRPPYRTRRHAAIEYWPFQSCRPLKSGELMYKPYRAALKAVRREFDRAASRYPRLFHEMLEYNGDNIVISSDEWEHDRELLERAYHQFGVPDDPREFSVKIEQCDHFSDIECDAIRRQLRRQRGEERFVVADSPAEVWTAFVAANQQREDGAWQTWEIMPNLTWVGRFFGAEDGLKDFRRLGETLRLILNEIHPSSGIFQNHAHALLDIYLMAESHRSPLLRVYDRMWDCDRNDGICDDILDEWKTNQLGKGYPLHPYCWGLVHDVFTSAIAAIDAILEPDSILLLSETRPLRLSPFFGALRTTEESQPEPATTPVETTPTTSEPFLFRREGDYWHLRFTSGDRVEEHKGFRHRVGFLRYQELLREKGHKIASFALQRLAKEPETERVPDEEAKEMGLSKVFGFDPIMNLDSKKALNKRIAEIEKESESARSDPARLLLLNKEREALNKIKNQSQFLGRPKELGSPSPDEKARKTVNKSFADVREAIQRSMPALELHLLDCVECENGDWVYKPSPDLDWSF